MFDGKALADQTISTVKDYVSRATAPLLERIATLEATIAELKSREIPRGEKGEPGVDGKDGAPGRDGLNGKDGANGKDGDRGPAGEIGKDGPSGLPGRDGRDGLQGLPGKDGLNGKDGHDGVDGKDGAPGLDGLGFDDLTCSLEDDGRVIVLRFVCGERSKEFRLNTGMTIYRGVFKDGQTYERGDMVTWAGSIWHANDEAKEKPGDGSKAWTLAVKKGRDGKDGERGLIGERGPQGLPGRDRYV